MSFSGTAVGQREQELKTIKTFLVYSLLGSLALHIGLLVSGVGNLLFKVPEVAEEPLEITLIETPPEPEPVQQVEPPKPEIPKKSQTATKSESPSGGGGSSVKSPAVSQIPAPSPQNPPVATQPSSVVEKPPSKIEPLPPLPSQRTSAPQPQAKAPDPQNILTQTSPTNSTTIPANPQASPNVDKLLAGMRNNRVNPGVSQPSQGTANSNNGGVTSNSTGISGNGGGGGGVGSGTGSGSGTGNGTGNGSGSGSQVATAPTSPKLRFNSDNLDGRAACRDCGTRYPQWAQSRRIEGRVVVAVDTDAQGNVTNVRLVSSSGHGRLDAEHLAQARKWKLKESAAGRRGVTIAAEYVIRDSQRSRQVQQAQKKRQQEQTNAESSNSATNSATQVTNRRKRPVSETNENIPTPSTTESTSSSTENSSSPPTNKRRRRREFNSDPSGTNNGDTAQPTRPPKILEQPTSSDQTPQQVQSPESSAN